MLAFGGQDAFWYVIAGAAVALGGALVLWCRRCFRWGGRKLKAAYLDWFSEAVEEHVGPKFEQLRQETQAMADGVADAARATAADVAARLEQHTQEEGEIVRAVVRSEIAPLRETLETHVASDSESFARIESSLSNIEGAQ